MNSAEWMARKLGRPAPTPQQQMPGQVSVNGAPPAHPTTQPAYQQPAQQPPDPNNIKPGDPGSFTHALETGQTKGGPATKQGKTGICPGCGSGNYIELPNGSNCFDCGWPLVQFGSDTGEGGSIQQVQGGGQ